MTSQTEISSFPESIYDEELSDRIAAFNSQSLGSKRIAQYSPHVVLQHAWHMFALQQLKKMSKTKKLNKNETIIVDDGDEKDVDITRIHEQVSNKPLKEEPVQLLSQLLGHESPPCSRERGNLWIPPVTNETPKSVPSEKSQEDCHKNKSKYGIRYKLYPCEHCDMKFQNIFHYEKHLIRLVFKLMLMISSI